ncbi:MAG: hypothetical protein KAI17_03355 [Thiotrichaceae bacterium]|nr:hypothetical protein [Thiotrichaceae bacterium]
MSENKTLSFATQKQIVDDYIDLTNLEKEDFGINGIHSGSDKTHYEKIYYDLVARGSEEDMDNTDEDEYRMLYVELSHTETESGHTEIFEFQAEK